MEELIKKRLSQAIKQSGIKQEDIANKVFVTQSCIAHYASGDALPSLGTFALLCKALELDPSEILGIDN